MKKVFNGFYSILFVLIISFFNCAYSQPEWNWVNSYGGTGNDVLGQSFQDGNGNIYHAGYFTGSITFGSITLTATGGSADQDIFVVKFDNNGNALWASNVGGVGNDQGRGVGVDNAGNIYVSALYYSSSITFNGTTVTNAGGGYADIVVVKFNYVSNTSYTQSWIKSYGSTGNEVASQIAVDGSTGDVYLNGSFASTVLFGSYNLSSSGGLDIFTLKLNNAGVVQWAKSGGSTTGDDGCYSVAIDNSGNVYTYGYIRGSSTFGSYSVPFGGLIDICLIQYNSSNGNENWAKSFGSSASDIGISVTVSANGHVDLTGMFQYTVTFGSAGSLTSNSSSIDMFVLQLDVNGNAIWVKGAGSPGDDRGMYIKTDQYNNIYIGGIFSQTINFGVATLTSSGGWDGYIAYYGDDGTIYYAMKSGSGSAGTDEANSIFTDNNGNIYVAGLFCYSETFSPTTSGGSITKTSAGNYDIYIAKLSGITYTWRGYVSTSWTTAGNWSPNGIPGAADNVIIQSVNYNPTISTAVTIKDFTMNSSTLTIDASPASLKSIGTANINGGTILGSGTVTLSGSNITIGAGTFTASAFNFGSATSPASSVTFGTSCTTPGPTITGNVNVYTNNLQMMKTNFYNTNYSYYFKVINSSPITTGIGGNYFDGNVTFEAAATVATASLALSSCAGSTYNWGATFKNSGKGDLYTAYAYGDTYHSTGTAGNTYNVSGTGGIYPNYTGTNSVDRNLVVTCATGGKGVFFGQNGGITNLPTTRVIMGNSFVDGTLELKNVTQASNVTTAQSITLTGTALLKFESGSVFYGSVTTSSPNLIINGTHFNGVTNLTKTGKGNDYSTGGNIFAGGVTITNTFNNSLYSGGLFLGGDSYTSSCTYVSSGTGGILPAYVGSTTYSSGIVLNSINGRSNFPGVAFGGGGGTATLTAGNISIGSSGFSSAMLDFTNFTFQPSTSSLNITLTGSAYLQFGDASVFNSPVVTSSPSVIIKGSTFNALADITKTGAAMDVGTDGALFANASVNSYIRNTGTGQFYLGAATFQGTVSYINTNTGGIYPARTGTTNYNGDIIVSCTSSNGNINGIMFCQSLGGSVGYAVLNANKTISVSTTGFNSGVLAFKNFTQQGSTTQTLSLTSTASLSILNSTFNGMVNGTAPRISYQNSTFNGGANLTKTSTGLDICDNGTFVGPVTIINNSSDELRLGGTNGDTYNGDATFTKQGTGLFRIAYAGSNSFTGNITTSEVTLGDNGGVVILNGSSDQIINSSYYLTIPKLTINKLESNVNVNVPLTVSNSLIFTNGNNTRINNGNNYLALLGSTTINGNGPTAFITGSVRKSGNVNFTFPIGKGNEYMPISIIYPSGASSSDIYQIEGFNSTPPYLTSHDGTISGIVDCQYWSFQYINSSDAIQVTLPWDANTCDVIDAASVKVARYYNYFWSSAGAQNVVNNPPNGSVTSNAYTSFEYVTFSSPTSLTLVPAYVKLKKDLDGGYYNTINNSLKFVFNEEYYIPSGQNLTYKVYDKNRSDVTSSTSVGGSYLFGEGSYDLNVSSLTTGDFYVLEVSNQKGEKWYLKFKKN